MDLVRLAIEEFRSGQFGTEPTVSESSGRAVA